jgi:GT2 family glycosyltransferase
VSRPTVSLVVVNYNSADLASSLLTAVGDGADEVIVVDNASPNGPAGLDELAARHPEANIIRLDVNRGYGAGANQGAQRAKGQVLVVANADLTISGPDLRELADQVGHDGVVLAAPRFVGPDGTLERSAHRREPRLLSTLDSFCGPFAHLARRVSPDWNATWCPSDIHTQDFDCLHVLGALMAIDADAFAAVGGFDESFFLYREETDLCRRLRRRGGRVRHVGHVAAVHVGGGSTADPWPHQGKVANLTSHYEYIAKHWGRPMELAARGLGTASSAIWLAAGPSAKRPLARRALRWHLGRPVDR